MLGRYRAVTLLTGVVASALTAAVLIGVAGAENTTPTTVAGIIYACQKNGDVKLTTQTTLCSTIGRDWKPINWNGTGPQGPAGPTGPAGATGAAGPAGAA